MPTYTIEVNRKETRTIFLDVEAKSDVEALSIADVLAANADFNKSPIDDAEYEFSIDGCDISSEELMIEKFFEKLLNYYAIAVDDKLTHIVYYIPEDRGGDFSEPLVELFEASLCFSPSDVGHIEEGEYITKVWLKGNKNPYEFLFLKAIKPSEEL